MTGAEFIAWRERLGFNRTEACAALGIAPNTITAYERDREIPRYVALACTALALNLAPWGERQPMLDLEPAGEEVEAA